MNPPDLFNDVLRTWSGLAGGFSRGPTSTAAPIDALLMQAHLASSATLLRSGQRATQSWLEYSQAASGAELPLQVDAARAHLRRLAEISADEARQMEQQMRALDEQLRALAAPAVPAAGDDEPMRRAKAKP